MSAPSPDAATGRPGPVPDEDSREYWSALRRHSLVLQRCTSCGATRFPFLTACPQCGSLAAEQVSSSGRGRIYSWIVAHVPVGSLTAAELPCAIVTVELDEGCRLLGRYASPAAPAIDQRVIPRFVDHENWTELVFESDDPSVARQEG